jgi:hypothetical protein
MVTWWKIFRKHIQLRYQKDGLTNLFLEGLFWIIIAFTIS